MATQNTNPTDNIFSGLKVVDFASFVAGPGAAVILIRLRCRRHQSRTSQGRVVENREQDPAAAALKIPYMWHLNNRNKRGVAIDLKSPAAAKVVERLAQWADVFIVNTPHPAREKLRLDYDHVSQFNPRLIYADITGYGDTGPDASSSRIRSHGLLVTERLAVSDARRRLSADLAIRRDRRCSVGGGLVCRNRNGALSARTHWQRLFRHHFAPGRGVWSAGVAIQAALSGAKLTDNMTERIRQTQR